MSNRRPTTQDISWFLDLESNGQLDLNPTYQRRSVWTSKDRQFFLDTIFRDYPCPAVFLHKSINSDGKQIYHVVDGKQRIETILKFVNNKVALSKEFGDDLYNGKRWKGLEANQRHQFWNYVLTVEMLNTIDGTIVNEVFSRLNRNSRRLEAQELRHAQFDGWLVSAAETEAEKDEWKQLGIATTTRAKRMKDVQFISELMLVVLDEKVVGFDQNYLDESYAAYDTPSETKADFREESFETTIRGLTSYLIDMENFNQSISLYARGLGNFYSLWSAIYLHSKDNSLPLAQITAEKYQKFMESVNELQKLEDPAEPLSSDDKQFDTYIYAKNSTGASTEYPQREARTNSLIKGIF